MLQRGDGDTPQRMIHFSPFIPSSRFSFFLYLCQKINCKRPWKDTRNALTAARKSLRALRNVCIARLADRRMA